MKRILFCIPGARTKEAGGSKVVVELAEEMRQIGWDCEILCPDDLPQPGRGVSWRDAFAENLRLHLRVHAQDFDIVDYDHVYLPFSRSEFAESSLFVARSVLLAHHLDRIQIPTPVTLRSAAAKIVKGRVRNQEQAIVIRNAQRTMEEADLVNVSNYEDKAELARQNLDVSKVVVIPYGIGEARRGLFDNIASDVPEQPVVAFVGTFDYRKGALDFPKIVEEIVKTVPQARFKLLGVQGMFRDEASILTHFPRNLRDKVDIVLKYKSDELPVILATCSVGVFPSYLEGFGFGVLEMLSASIPVIAYDAPGPPMMLSSEYLVTPGDTRTMGSKVAALLQDRASLYTARVRAKERSKDFTWQQIAKTTSDIYENQYERKKSSGSGRSVSR